MMRRLMLPTAAVSPSVHIDPHPIRTAIGVIRGALWLRQEGAPAEASHELLEHGLTRLKVASEQVLAEYRDLMAELDGRPGLTIWFARMAIALGIKRVRRRALSEETGPGMLPASVTKRRQSLRPEGGAGEGRRTGIGRLQNPGLNSEGTDSRT